MGLFFRKSKKIAPGVRLNVSKRGLGLSAGVPGAREAAAPARDVRLALRIRAHYYRKRLRKGGEGGGPELEEQTRNLAFGNFVLEKAQSQGLEEVSDEFLADAAEEFFGDATSPDARASIAYVNNMG